MKYTNYTNTDYNNKLSNENETEVKFIEREDEINKADIEKIDVELDSETLFDPNGGIAGYPNLQVLMMVIYDDCEFSLSGLDHNMKEINIHSVFEYDDPENLLNICDADGPIKLSQKFSFKDESENQSGRYVSYEYPDVIINGKYVIKKLILSEYQYR